MEKTIINPVYLEKGLSYLEYKKLVDELLAQGKTTGPNQSEFLTHYTNLNVHRMHRLDKTVKLKDELVDRLKSIAKKQTWLILTEGWCGDAAQNIPVIEKMAAVNPLIHTVYILRDENLELMDQYLTHGSRSIPKVIFVDSESMEELNNWGPRPDACVEYIAQIKKENPDMPKEEWIEKVHKWYADDKTESVQKEFMALLDTFNP